jgi:uroporphyrinogen decarboxylase
MTDNRVMEIFGRIGDTVGLVKERLPKEVALIGFAGSPWTVACYMVEGGGSRDFETVRRFAIEQEAAFSHLIDQLTHMTIGYLSVQIEMGAEAIQLFDSWAGVLPEEEFSRWVIAPTQAIVKALKDRFPHISIIGFPRNAGALYVEYAKCTGVNALSLDFTMPLAWVKERLQPLAVVQGNLDPLLLAADKNKATQRAKEIITTWGDKPFVFNLGHGMVPHTPPEHLHHLCDFLRSFCHDEHIQ